MSVCIQQAFRESKSPTEISVVNQKNSKTNLDQGSEESEKSFARNLKTVIANLIGACCINQLLLQWVWEDQRVPILTNPATWTSNTKSTQNCDDSTFPLFPSWIWNWEHCLLLKLNLSWVKRLQGSERRSCILYSLVLIEHLSFPSQSQFIGSKAQQPKTQILYKPCQRQKKTRGLSQS